MKTSIHWHCRAMALVLIAILGSAVAEVRKWTSADGKFTVEAEMLSVQDGKVSLRKADGTEIKVPLTNLSVADRLYATRDSHAPALIPVKGKTPATNNDSFAEKQPASKIVATGADINTIREIAERFYNDLRTTERVSAAASLTAEAQKLATENQSPLASLPSPDEGASALKFGKPKVDGNQAEVPVQVKLDGNLQKTILHFRSEENAWRVFALSAVLGKDEKTINFETPLSVEKKQEDPLVALIGQKMELEGVTFDSRRLNMDDYKGKVVLVDFWATWCGPCRAEIPNILANWQKFHDSGFEVIAISVDQDLDELKKFVAAERPPWTVIADRHPLNRNSMGRKFGITGIPAFVLIGPDGKVATVHCRGERLGQALANLLPTKNKTAAN